MAFYTESSGEDAGGGGLFSNSYKYDKKTSRGGGGGEKENFSKAHKDGEIFHKTYNNDIQFPFFSHIRSCSSESSAPRLHHHFLRAGGAAG